MEQSPFVQAGLTEAIWVLVAAPAGLLATIAAVVLLAQGRRVPAWVAALGVALVAVSGAAAGVAGGMNPDRMTGVLAAGVIRVLAALAVLPLAWLGLLGLGVLGAQGERSWRLPAMILGGVALTAAATACEGWMGGNVLFGGVRAGLALLLGGCVALAAAGPDRRALAAAGSLWAWCVVAIEAAERGLVAAFALTTTVRVVKYPKRAEALDQMLATVQPEVPFAWVTVGLAIAVAGAALWLHRDEAPVHRGLGVLGLLVLPALLFVGVPGRDALVEAAAAGPPPAPRTHAPPAGPAR